MTRSGLVIAVATSLVALLALAVHGISAQGVELALLAVCLGVASCVDVRERVIPNACVAVALCVRLAFLAYQALVGQAEPSEMAYYLVSGLGLGLLLVAFVVAFERVVGRAGMGGGDLKLYAVSGAYAGFESGLLVVFVSCLLGTLAGLLAPRSALPPDAASSGERPGLLGRALPFGPAISVSLMLVLLAPSLSL